MISAEMTLSPFVEGNPFLPGKQSTILKVRVLFREDGQIYTISTGQKTWTRVGPWGTMSLDSWCSLLEKNGWKVTLKPHKEKITHVTTEEAPVHVNTARSGPAKEEEGDGLVVGGPGRLP